MEKQTRGETLASWRFPEFVKYERTAGWYIAATAVGAGLFLYAILARNFLFALIIVMTALIFFLYESKRPELLRFSIMEDGAELGKNFYLWKDLKNFWIIYEPPEVKTLYFETKRIFFHRLSIPLEKENPLLVRKILLKYLPEDLTKESEATSDTLERLLKL